MIRKILLILPLHIVFLMRCVSNVGNVGTIIDLDDDDDEADSKCILSILS